MCLWCTSGDGGVDSDDVDDGGDDGGSVVCCNKSTRPINVIRIIYLIIITYISGYSW